MGQRPRPHQQPFLLAGGLLLKSILGSKLTIERALDGIDLSFIFEALIDL